MSEPNQIGTDTWITMGSALVVIGAAVKGTMVMVNIQRDLRGIMKRIEFKLWASRLKASNPSIHVPELEEDDDDDSA